VEGHIGIVQIQGSIGDNYVIRQHIEHLKSQHPIKSSELESFLLRIRDLEGVSYKGVLASVKEEVKELVEYRSAGAENGIEFDEVVEEGAVKLLLVPSVTKWRANISLDNYGSVYYNPHNLSVYAQNTILPLSQTSISGLLSLPMEQFQFAAIDHTVNVMRDVNLELHAEKQASEPGDILKKLAMTGQAEAYSAAIRYNPIRQRNMNMYIRASLESRNGQSKSLSFIANVDKMRAARLALTTDWIDSFSGFNSFNTRYTQGLAKLGASRMGSNTVRENTKPDFSKIDANLARLQGLTKEWFIYGALTGQYTKHIVFSSEEFGYGGRQFGRAFDSNDFKGFKGYAYSLELRYEGVPKIKNVALHPYSFFDAGELWSRVRLSSAIERKRASSAGLGIRFETWFNMNGNIGLALPVEQKIPKPIYSGSKNGPRVILSVSQSF
jgi:hemolysin activation/secretion protein